MLGLCSVTFENKEASEVIAIAKEAGLEGIEWGAREHVPHGDIEKATEVQIETDKAGLKVTSYGSYYKVGSNEDFQTIIATAQALGTNRIRVWAGEKGSAETSEEERTQIVADAKRIADLAAEAEIDLNFEYHSNTLTDTPESTKQLLAEVAKENMHIYWQPAESLSIDERVESLKDLIPSVTNIHVFHWLDYNHRFPMEEGIDTWQRYLEVIQADNSQDRDLLFEFVLNNSSEQLVEDVKVFKELLDKK